MFCNKIKDGQPVTKPQLVFIDPFKLMIIFMAILQFYMLGANTQTIFSIMKRAISLLLVFALLPFLNLVNAQKIRECGDPSWKAYSSTDSKVLKCFKVLGVMTKAEAKTACSKEIQYSFEDSLLTVKTFGEQDFIAAWLLDPQKIKQNLWLAARRTDQNKWEWEDDNTPIEYNNWERGSKLNSTDDDPQRGKKCLQMLWEDDDAHNDNDPDTIGRWQPTSCSERNLAVCQKPQVSQQWRSVERVIADMQRNNTKMRKDLEQTRECFKQSQSRSKKFEADLKATQRENIEIKEVLKELSVENQRLNQELQIVVAALNQTQQEALNMQDQFSNNITSIEENFGQLKQDSVKTKEGLEHLNKENSQVKKYLNQLQIETFGTQQNLSLLNNKTVEATQDIAQLQIEASVRKQDQGQLQNETFQVKQDVSFLKNQTAETTQHLGQLQNETVIANQLLNSNLQTVFTTINQTHIDVLNTQNQVGEVKRNVTTMQENFGQLKNESAETVRGQAQTKEALGQLIQNNLQIKRDLGQLQNETVPANHRLTLELQNSVKALNQTRQDQFLEVKSDVTKIQSNLGRLSNETSETVRVQNQTKDTLGKLNQTSVEIKKDLGQLQNEIVPANHRLTLELQNSVKALNQTRQDQFLEVKSDVTKIQSNLGRLSNETSETVRVQNQTKDTIGKLNQTSDEIKKDLGQLQNEIVPANHRLTLDVQTSVKALNQTRQEQFSEVKLDITKIIGNLSRLSSESSETARVQNQTKDAIGKLNQTSVETRRDLGKLQDETVPANHRLTLDLQTSINKLNQTRQHQFSEVKSDITKIQGNLSRLSNESSETIRGHLQTKDNIVKLNQSSVEIKTDLGQLQNKANQTEQEIGRLRILTNETKQEMISNDVSLLNRISILQGIEGGKCGGFLDLSTDGSIIRCNQSNYNLNLDDSTSVLPSFLRVDPFIWFLTQRGSNRMNNLAVTSLTIDSRRSNNVPAIHRFIDGGNLVSTILTGRIPTNIGISTDFPFALVSFNLNQDDGWPPLNRFEGFQMTFKPASSNLSSNHLMTFDDSLLAFKSPREFRHPLYDENYSNNERRVFVLRPQPGHKIRLIFSTFMTEEKYDYLSIFRFPRTLSYPTLITTMIGRLGSSNLNRTIDGGKDELLLMYFHSDGSSVDVGFRMQYCSLPA